MLFFSAADGLVDEDEDEEGLRLLILMLFTAGLLVSANADMNEMYTDTDAGAIAIAAMLVLRSIRLHEYCSRSSCENGGLGFRLDSVNL